MLSRLFIAGLLAFLLLGAGYGASQAARYTPWDCSDWQAFAHADRATAILESLAENRGKTLYCGIDQSDTFAKAETWAAGRDHNERDGTVYQGENGRFRGFIAAQEGWLTEGESGITGQPISTIFEFPTEGRAVRRTKRFAIATDPAQFPINALASCGQVLGLICSGWGPDSGLFGDVSTAHVRARTRLIGSINDGNTDRTVNWRTQVITNRANNNNVEGTARTTTADWLALAKTAALRACQARGGKAVSNLDFGPGHNGNQSGPGLGGHLGLGLGFFLSDDLDARNNIYKYQARQSRTWSATCKKVIRRNR